MKVNFGLLKPLQSMYIFIINENDSSNARLFSKTEKVKQKDLKFCIGVSNVSDSFFYLLKKNICTAALVLSIN